MQAETVFNRLCFLEGEWIGKSQDGAEVVDKLVCTLEHGKLTCISELLSQGGERLERKIEFWIEDDKLRGTWTDHGANKQEYLCEYDSESDEFLFNLTEMATSLDYKTIRRLNNFSFITMEQSAIQGTSSVRSFEMSYRRTL
ncbi:MAG: hypothetical protein QXP70_00555 [Methanomassiliicoccales archaeon]